MVFLMLLFSVEGLHSVYSRNVRDIVLNVEANHYSKEQKHGQLLTDFPLNSQKRLQAAL